jgi:hypothetical protein
VILCLADLFACTSIGTKRPPLGASCRAAYNNSQLWHLTPNYADFVARDSGQWTTQGALCPEDTESSCSRQPEDSYSLKWYFYFNRLLLNGMGFIAIKIGGANIL